MPSARTVRWTLLAFWLLFSICHLPAEEPPPELSLPDLSGARQSLGAYKGKVVVLNFWATWCVPCAEEMPMLVDIQKRYAGQGVVVIGVSLDDATTQAKIAPFVRKTKVNFPIWLGATTENLKRLGLGEALPATAFFDQEGRITGRVLGKLRKKDLNHRVEWLLGNHQGDPPNPLVNNLGFK